MTRIEIKKVITYEWICPHCENPRIELIDLRNEDILYCSNCNKDVFVKEDLK